MTAQDLRNKRIAELARGFYRMAPFIDPVDNEIDILESYNHTNGYCIDWCDCRRCKNWIELQDAIAKYRLEHNIVEA